ncbi:MAG: peptidylprolyl isomerase FKBP-type [Ferruginibacter sp.]|nr:peptidylprolyl isomerase FKBP-type [Ferruginibacter sp.]
MKHFFYLLAVTSLLFASCTTPFKKSEGGLQYKIISDGKGNTIKGGNFFEIQFDQVYSGAGKDTVLFDSKTFSNQIVSMDSAAIPPVYYKIFAQSRKGDSIVVKQSTDSIMKGGNTPPFMKKGAFIVAHYKIVNVFETKASADSANKIQMELAKAKDSVKAIAQLKKDDKIIADYLAKNNIQAVKAPQGTYVEIITPGVGETADTSKVLKVFYTGRSLEGGKPFDSNTDSAFGHMQVYPVNMGALPGTPGSAIKGWMDGLSLLKKGSKARLYIPSSLAYGAQGAGGDIKPDANLVFDVEVVDMVSTQQAMAEAAAQRKKMEEEQKKSMEAAQKAQNGSKK